VSYSKNKYKVFFLLLVVLIFQYAAQSQTKMLTNLDVLENCYKDISKDILKDISSDNKSVLLNVDSDSNTFLFEQIFRNELSLNGFVVISKADSLFSKVNVYSETKIKYEKIEGDENFFRDVLVSSIVSVNSDENTKLYKNNYSDTLSTHDIDYISNKKIKVYSEGLNKTNFWDSLLKPVIILGSAGLLVYLLFTVRSK
jgi:hypothetical protein